MTREIFKKTIGTTLVVAVFAASIFMATGNAAAFFRYIGSDFRGSGKVTAVGPSSFELVTSGSTWPFTMVVSGGTTYSGGYGSLADVAAGDEVSVVANRTTGDFTTLEVRKIPDPASYGSAPCEDFIISSALFERPVNDTIYVVKEGIGVKVNTTTDTQVLGGTFDDLLPGTQVQISGLDCRSEGTLTAQTIQIVTNEGLEACNSFGEGSIVVRNQSVLLAHDANSARTPVLSANVPAGNYRVHGVSFDNHSTSPWDTEAREQWYATGLNSDSVTFTSGTTDDLPNGIDYNTTTVNESVTVNNLDAVQLVHSVSPGTDGYQSVYPICVVFEPISTTPVLDLRQ